MVHSDSTYYTFDNALLPAILISLGLHLFVLAFVHPLPTDADPLFPPLEVTLLAPKPPPPPPPPHEPPKPEPPKPTPTKAPPPPVRIPLPPPVPHDDRPAPPPPSITPPAQILSQAPAQGQVPTLVVPAPVAEVKATVEPAVDVEAELGKYGNQLAYEFAKYKQYPRIAQLRGWQGTVRVKLEVDAGGVVTSSTISDSSGFDVLDKQALEMAKKATPLPLPPESLRHHPFVITVPVMFRLE